MTQADLIRNHVINNYVVPARSKNRCYVVVQSGDVHDALKLVDNHPNVCQAIGGQLFLQQANVRLVERSSPHQSSTVEWVFAVK
jgi:5-methylcytosine-specific restriction protein B